MRTALAMIVAILTLSPGPRLVIAQTHVGDVPDLESIHMTDALTGWAVTPQQIGGALLRTTNGGTQWKNVTPLDSWGQTIRVGNFDVLSSSIAWVLPAGTIGATTATIFHTVDGGRTWKNVTIPIPNVEAIHFINSRDGWLVASLAVHTGNDEVEIHRSTDGGETWTKVASATRDSESSGLPVDGDKSAITFLNPTTGWITGVTAGPEWLYIYVTHDGGHTWRHQNLPLPSMRAPHWLGFPQPPKFFTALDGLLPVFYSLLESRQETGMVFVLYATRDGGKTWEYTAPLSITRVNGFSPRSFVDMEHGWVREGTALFVTSDGGRQWLAIQLSQSFADVTQLDFISRRIGWAVRGTSPFLLKTADGGHTWVPVTYTISRR